jgi:hypothetical protein
VHFSLSDVAVGCALGYLDLRLLTPGGRHIHPQVAGKAHAQAQFWLRRKPRKPSREIRSKSGKFRMISKSSAICK